MPYQETREDAEMDKEVVIIARIVKITGKTVGPRKARKYKRFFHLEPIHEKAQVPADEGRAKNPAGDTRH